MEINDRIFGEIPKVVAELFAIKDYRKFRSALISTITTVAQAERYQIHYYGKYPGKQSMSPCRCIVPIEGQRRQSFYLVLDRPDHFPFAVDECEALVFLGELISDEIRRRSIGSRQIIESLTTREKEVASLAAQGMSNRGIASALEISEETVKRHLYNIFNKTGACSRTNLFSMLSKQEEPYASP